ncbi:MAG: uroporphyrinogen decarboxylase, partial [Chloroflexi bacterium]|nr:uroporphyrinogen decarboxylase [Chloroflexota bacterium]
MSLEARYLRAARGLPVDTTPVWFMRQAGRALPEYRKVRERATLLEITRDPALCAEVTLQPVRRLGVDAAILFADITTPLAGLGVAFDIKEGVGPVIEHPVRTMADVEGLHP